MKRTVQVGDDFPMPLKLKKLRKVKVPRIRVPKLPTVNVTIETKVITATSKRMKLPPGHAKALAAGLKPGGVPAGWP